MKKQTNKQAFQNVSIISGYQYNIVLEVEKRQSGYCYAQERENGRERNNFWKSVVSHGHQDTQNERESETMASLHCSRAPRHGGDVHPPFLKGGR